MNATDPDFGAKTRKVVFLGGRPILLCVSTLTSLDQEAIARQAFHASSVRAGMTSGRVEKVIATGVGTRTMAFASNHMTEVAARAKGSHNLCAKIQRVVDVWARSLGDQVRLTTKVAHFSFSEKCAASICRDKGEGLTAREMSSLSQQSQRATPLNFQYIVLDKSEAITLMHAKTDKHDISRTVHEAITSRIGHLVHLVSVGSQGDRS
jgi:activator of 2-hydroxyglutaryl-CoA dehydratase